MMMYEHKAKLIPLNITYQHSNVKFFILTTHLIEFININQVNWLKAD